MLVLVPVPTATHCLLNEAVDYAALGRLPLNCNPILKFVPAETGWVEREDFQWQQAISDYASAIGLPVGYVPSGTSIPPKRYEAVGVDLHPLWNAIGKQPTSEGIDDDHGVTAARREEALEKYEVFLDSFRLRLRSLLHEGRLTSRGKKLGSEIRIEEAAEIDVPVNSVFEPISPDFWASANVAWRANCAQGRRKTYKFIQLATENLFKEFPLPKPEPALEILQLGDNFVLPEELTTKPLTLPPLGRPPLKWDEFHLEVAKVLKENKLPPKQEAFIGEMQAWCRIHWGQEVGRSTLLQKIKPYYDSFMRSKRSEYDQ
jgi:hypothetical protein